MNQGDSEPRSRDQATSDEPSSEAVRAQLAKITASQTFESTPVLRRLLQHIVELTLAGKTESLKEYSLGTDVFGRGVSFDTRLDTIVRVQARRLRSRLQDYYGGEGAADPVAIELPKGHYVPRFRFIHPIVADTHELTEALSQSPAHVNAQLPAHVNAKAKSGAGLWTGLLLGAALTSIVGSLTFWRGDRRELTAAAAPSEMTASEVPGPHRIAVKRFENRTTDATLDPFGQQVADRIVGTLAQLRVAELVPRPLTLDADATTVGATLVVDGTYYVQGSRLQLQPRILDARSGRVLHATPLITVSRSRPAEAIAPLEQRVAGAIAIHLDDFFGGLDVVSQPPSLDAYRNYRAALEIFHSDYARTLMYAQRATEGAPGFLTPLVLEIFARGNLGQPDEAESTLRLLEDQSEAHSPGERLLVEFLRAVQDGRRPQALRVLKDLDRLAPGSALVNFNLAQQLVLSNQPRAAVEVHERGAFNAQVFRHSIGSYRHFVYGNALHALGAYDRELRQATVAQQFAPGVLRLLEVEARALIALGRVEEASSTIQRSLSLSPAAGWPETPGDVMERTAEELRAHGHRAASLDLATRAVDWYRGRQPEPATQRRHWEGLARVLYLAERWVEARQLFTELLESTDDVVHRGTLGQIAARTGDVATARAISDDLQGVAARDSARAAYERAAIAALIGDRARAIDLLREAFNHGFGYGLHTHNDPDFESLADYKPFVELVRPAG